MTQAWFRRASINYADYYIRLYIAFNAWYQSVSHTTNDRQALEYIKGQTGIWKQYIDGVAMQSLRPHMVLLVDLTQREPAFQKPHFWNGSVEGLHDWPSLVEYWYQVRCHTVHGSEVRQDYLQLAYHTLHIFLEEVFQARAYLLTRQNRV